MTTGNTALSELLYMASIYRSRHRYDLAKTLLQDLLQTLLLAQPTDNESVGIVKYCLAQIYTDQSSIPFARVLFRQAAKHYDGFQYNEAYGYGSMRLLTALAGLEQKSQELINCGQQRFKPRRTA